MGARSSEGPDAEAPVSDTRFGADPTSVDHKPPSPTRKAFVGGVEDAIGRRLDTRGERFEMTLGELSFRSRADAGAALKHAASRPAPASPGHATHLGRLDGLALDVRWDHDSLGALANVALMGPRRRCR